VTLEDVRVGGEGLDLQLFFPVVGCGDANRDEGRDRKTDLGPVQSCMVALDVPGLFQSLYAFHYGGSGEPYLVGDGLVAGPAVGGEEPEDAAGDGIGRELGHSQPPGDCQLERSSRIVS
jgi:hypothetical protein